MEHSDRSIPLYGSDESQRRQRAAVRRGAVPVAVYGLGKMGLPLATALAHATDNVIGADLDSDHVDRIRAGDCPIQGEPDLAEELETAVERDRFAVTDDPTAAATRGRVHVIIVPTLLDEADEPDLSALEQALEDVSTGLEAGDMVVVESTVPPGTCREVVQPTLADSAGLEPTAFGLAFCPERTASGRALRDIRGAYPKVVGGRDVESTRVAELLYSELTSNEVVPVSDPTTAECVKLFEGIYRDVNIALANELARQANVLGIDVVEAIDVANTPEYCNIHQPGPGVGGHCIPFYPYFLIETDGTKTPLLRTARAINEDMPGYTVDRLAERLGERGIGLGDATVAIVGVTYRAGVDETRRSPAFPIAEELSDAGTTVYAADPVCSTLEEIAARQIALEALPDLDLDAVLVLTADERFRDLPWDRLEDVLVLDGRRVLETTALDHEVCRLGDGRQERRDSEPLISHD